MKKYLAIFLGVFLYNSSSEAQYGAGEVKLSENVIKDIEYYIDHPKGKPYVFLITEDGMNATFWYCAHSRCVPTGSMDERKICERKYGKKCFVFMIRRSIKWKNEATIAARGREKSFSSSDNNIEVRRKLKNLGFID